MGALRETSRFRYIACESTYMYVYVHICVYAQHIYNSMYVYIYMYICTCICVCACIYVCACTRIYAPAHTHTCRDRERERESALQLLVSEALACEAGLVVRCRHQATEGSGFAAGFLAALLPKDQGILDRTLKLDPN